MLYIVYQQNIDDSASLREIHKPAHFAYLEQWQHKLVLGGAMMPDDANGRIGSVLILNVDSRADVILGVPTMIVALLDERQAKPRGLSAWVNKQPRMIPARTLAQLARAGDD